MNSVNELINLYEPIIDTLPGFIAIHDVKSTVLLTNDFAAKTMGFKCASETQGIQYSEMKCQASLEHGVFRDQDTRTFSLVQTTRFLSYHHYASEWKLFLGEKKPVLNNNNQLIGLVAHCSDLTHLRLIDKARFIFSSNQYYLPKNCPKFTYSIQNEYSNSYLLNQRQLECLFFILRGKSDRAIGKILNLSRRTIESYTNQIKLKFDCSTREQLVEKSINEGLLSLLPESLLTRQCSGY